MLMSFLVGVDLLLVFGAVYTYNDVDFGSIPRLRGIALVTSQVANRLSCSLF